MRRTNLMNKEAKIGFMSTSQKSCKQEELSEIFKGLREEKHQPRILYP